MPLGQWSITVTLILSNQFFYKYFYSIIKHGTILVVTLPVVGRFSLHKRKMSEFWQVHNTEPNAEVSLNN
jgi:hypothetical protein